MPSNYSVSVVVPSTNYSYLKHLLSSLSRQTLRPYEVVIVVKGFNSRHIEELCTSSNLRCVVIEQTRGYFTHALNLGKRRASGDIVVFTDDDAIAPPKWIERYVKLHQMYRDNIACVSSRDIYIDLKNMRTEPTPDDIPYVRLYRWLIRPWLEKPHPLLRKYRLGVYLTKDLKMVPGPYIPSRTCYSLPRKGVNMSFKGEALDKAEFPEHPLLRRSPKNEQYVGLQLVLKGWDCVYVPDNPISHIMHESLSRTSNKKEIRRESEVMRDMYAKLIGREL
jgi:glycosyltransferase involved in cell wall biosynthesis